jgi:FkbM family methyltransferase
MSSKEYQPAGLRDFIAVHAGIRAGRLNRFSLVRKLRRGIVKVLARERRGVLVKTPYGFKLEVPAFDTRLMDAVLHGVLFEPSLGQALQQILRPGDVVLDGGAHVGLYTILSALCVGHSGRVIAFEPHPINVRSLRSNIELNGVASRVRVEEAALSDRAGTADFNWSPSLTTHGRLLSSPAADGKTSRVRTVAFDEYLSAMSERVDVIKLDLEGGELLGLRGMPRAVSRARCVILEINEPRLREQRVAPSSVVDWVMEVGGFNNAVVLPLGGAAVQPIEELGSELAKFGFSNVMLLREG